MRIFKEVLTGIAIVAFSLGSPIQAQQGAGKKQIKEQKETSLAEAREYREMAKAEGQWHLQREKEAAAREREYRKVTRGDDRDLAKAEREIYRERAKTEAKWHRERAKEAAERERKIRKEEAKWNRERSLAENEYYRERSKAEAEFYRARNKEIAQYERDLLKRNRKMTKQEEKLYKERAKAESEWYSQRERDLTKRPGRSYNNAKGMQMKRMNANENAFKNNPGRAKINKGKSGRN